jgi:hypothetical protein
VGIGVAVGLVGTLGYWWARRAAAEDEELGSFRTRVEQEAFGRGFAVGMRLRVPSGGVRPDEGGAVGFSLSGPTDTRRG